MVYCYLCPFILIWHDSPVPLALVAVASLCFLGITNFSPGFFWAMTLDISLFETSSPGESPHRCLHPPWVSSDRCSSNPLFCENTLLLYPLSHRNSLSFGFYVTNLLVSHLFTLNVFWVTESICICVFALLSTLSLTPSRRWLLDIWTEGTKIQVSRCQKN